eukprot:COSAG02_NODE_1862_length_10609_cov_36.585616_2_plen_40_part_00
MMEKSGGPVEPVELGAVAASLGVPGSFPGSPWYAAGYCR